MKTRMYSCEHQGCYKSFRSEESLREHSKQHSTPSRDPKDFTCSECDRVLSTKQSLKEHIYTHLNKKQFRCSEIGCGKTFKQSSQLCNHRKVHKEARQMVRSENRHKEQILRLDDSDSIVQDEHEKSIFSLPPISNTLEPFLPKIDLLKYQNQTS